MFERKLILDDDFCDGCCYNNNPRPELRCNKIKCCYLVKNECILTDEGYLIYRQK